MTTKIRHLNALQVRAVEEACGEHVITSGVTYVVLDIDVTETYTLIHKAIRERAPRYRALFAVRRKLEAFANGSGVDVEFRE